MNKKFLSNKNSIIILGIICLFIIPIIVNIIITIPCKWASGSNDWIGFFGAYLSALASFAMAFITYKTLKLNEKQLKIINEQNSPHLNVYIENVYMVKRNPDEKGIWESLPEYKYVLYVHNYGSKLASNIKVKLDNSKPKVFENQLIKTRIDYIQDYRFALQPGETKSFVLFYSIPSIKEPNRNEIVSLVDKLNNSEVIIKLTYDNQGDDSNNYIIMMKDVPDHLTTEVEVLGYINNNISDFAKSLIEIVKENK